MSGPGASAGGGPVTVTGEQAGWLDYGPAEFDRARMPTGSRPASPDQGALFMVAVPPRQRKTPARAELDGQGDLFGGAL